MTEEKKGMYMVVSEYSHFCILYNNFEKDAVEIAKIIQELEEENNPRIFKIEKEIFWQEEKKEKTDLNVIPNIREIGGSLDF